MKNLKSAIAGVLFFGLLIVFPMFVVGSIENHYRLNGYVSLTYGDTVRVVDEQGESWEFIGTGFQRGDDVRITFFSNCTDRTREDDAVVKVKVISRAE